jgi:hypothetical protein
MPDQPPYDFVYVHTDIREGMTIGEWRAERAARVAQHRAAQRRARRERTPAMFIKSLSRLLRELGLRATVRALPGHWQGESR